MEHIEKYFIDTPNTGFRVFRDDELLKRREEKVKCSRCSLWFWPDEMKNSLFQEKLCRLCAVLVDSRVKSLEKGRKGSCPVSSKEFIFTKKYHARQGRGGL